MNEFGDLIKKASKQLGCYVELTTFNDGKFALLQAGREYAVDCGTFEACIAKLKEWATPPKPETITVTVPYYAAVNAACGTPLNGFVPFSSAVQKAFKEAIKPYEV